MDTKKRGIKGYTVGILVAVGILSAIGLVTGLGAYMDSHPYYVGPKITIPEKAQPQQQRPVKDIKGGYGGYSAEEIARTVEELRCWDGFNLNKDKIALRHCLDDLKARATPQPPRVQPQQPVYRDTTPVYRPAPLPTRAWRPHILPFLRAHLQQQANDSAELQRWNEELKRRNDEYKRQEKMRELETRIRCLEESQNNRENGLGVSMLSYGC